MRLKKISICYITSELNDRMIEYISMFDQHIDIHLCRYDLIDVEDFEDSDLIFFEINELTVPNFSISFKKKYNNRIVAVYTNDAYSFVRSNNFHDHILVDSISRDTIATLLMIENIRIENDSIFSEIKDVFQSALNSGLKIKKTMEKLNFIKNFKKVIYYELQNGKMVSKYFFKDHNEEQSCSLIDFFKIKSLLKECETIHIPKSVVPTFTNEILDYGVFVYLRINSNIERLLVVDLEMDNNLFYLYNEFLSKVTLFIEIEEQRLFNSESVSESDSRFRLMIENSRDLIVVLNKGIIKFANSRFLEVSGYSMFDVLETDIANYIISYQKDGQIFYEFDNIDFDDQNYKLDMLHAGGSIIYTETRGVFTSLMGEDSVILFINDITDFQNYQNKINESNEKLDGIISSMEDTTVLIVDELGKLIYVKSRELNDAKYGIDFLGGEGKRIKEVLPQELCKKIDYSIELIKSGEKSITIDYNFYKHDVEFWFDIDIKSMQLEDMSLNRFILVLKDVSKIKRAEKDAYESAKYLKEVFNNVGEGLFILDSKWEIKDVNQIFQIIFDYEKEEVIGEHFSNIFKTSGISSDFLLDMIKKEMTFSHHYVNEHVFKKKIYETFYAQVYITAMFDASGHITNYVGSVKDITEIHQMNNELLEKTKASQLAEEKVREINNYLRNIFNNMDDVVLVLNRDGFISSCNGSYNKLFGFDASDLLNKRLEDIFDLENKIEFEREYSYICKDNSVIYLSLKSTKDNNNQTIVTIHDITPIKEIQIQIEKNELKFRSLFEVSHDAILFSDNSGNIFDKNKAAQKMLILGDNANIRNYIFEHDLEKYDTMINHLNDFYYSKNELRMFSYSEYIDVELSIFSVGNKSDGSLYYVYTLRDITEQKRVNAMKDEFVSIVSHELKTPITSIDGSLKLLLGGVMGELPDRVVNILKLASRNSVRLIDLINDILDIQKMEAGQMQYVIEEIPLRDLIESTVEESAGYKEKYGVNVIVENIENIYISSDKLKIGQVILNLLSNSIKFSEKGKDVIVYSEINGDYIRIHVKDEGVGIPDNFKDKIFNKFSQSELSITRKSDGTGLGLSIAKQIVEHFGGRIDFVSEMNVGTDFYFDLPILRRG